MESIAAAGGTADFVAGDLRDTALCRSVVDRTLARHGRLDALVTCASVPQVGTADRVSDAAWPESIALNVNAVFYVTGAAIPVDGGSTAD